MTRTCLTASTTFYVSPSGSDTTGNGSQSAPWATPYFARNWAAANIDCCGFPVTFNVAAGTYARTPNLRFPLVGQGGGNNGSDETWQGAGSTSTIFQPDASSPSGYGFGMAAGAQAWITGIGFDMTVAPQDAVCVSGFGTVLTIGADVRFGYNIFPYDDIDACFGALVYVNDGPTLAKPSITASATWGAQSGGEVVLTVSNPSGTIVPYLGVENWLGAYVAAVSGDQVTVASLGPYVPNQLPGSGGSGTVTFLSGGNAFVSTSAGAQVYFNNNGASQMAVDLTGNVYYQSALFELTDTSCLTAQDVVLSGGVNYGLPFWIRSGAALDSNFAGVFAIQSQLVYDTVATGTQGQNTVSVASSGLMVVGNAIQTQTAGLIPNGTVILGIDGGTVTMSKCLAESINGEVVFFGGVVTDGHLC